MPIPDQILKGKTFVDGDIVDGASLNQLVDDASALHGIIDEKTAIPGGATAGDNVLLSRASVLYKANVNTFPSGVTTLSMTAAPAAVFGVTVTNPTTTPAIALTLDNQTANKFLGGPASGSATPAFRVLVPSDLPVATQPIAAGNIDCTLGNVFSKTLPTGVGPFGLTISSLSDGQTIRVRIINNAVGNNHINWIPATLTIVWRDTGPAPVVTQAPNARDIFTFTRIDTLIYGYADQRFTT